MANNQFSENIIPPNKEIILLSANILFNEFLKKNCGYECDFLLKVLRNNIVHYWSNFI